MKKSIYIAILSLVGLGSCASQKKMQTQPPFVLEEASFQKWIGGKEESSSGIEIKIPINKFKKEDVTFKEIYFRGKISTATLKITNDKQYVMAKYTDQKLHKPDIIMHADPRKEVGNQPPMSNKVEEIDFPFELAVDEAVVSYTENKSDKVKFTKIIGIKEK
jgi:hypothetical protein